MLVDAATLMNSRESINCSGKPRSIARAITLVENGGDEAAEMMKAVFPRTGKAFGHRHYRCSGSRKVFTCR